jgi:hypothetical protein
MDSSSQAETRRACTSWIDRGDASSSSRPEGAPDALEALTGAAERLSADGDARAAFPDIYAIITRRVVERAALGPGGFFLEPQWISRLAGRFCQRYLETLRWSLDRWPQDAEAWTVAYASCELAGSPPLANVLLGLSAHINFDLAIGIYRTIVELGAASDPARLARFKHDHDAVNVLLDESIPEAFDRLIQRHGCPVAGALFDHAYVVSRWATLQILATWRGRVWDDALELLAADSAAARDVVVRRMERRSGRYARLLAFSLPHGADARRDPPGRGGGMLGCAAAYLRALGALT